MWFRIVLALLILLQANFIVAQKNKTVLVEGISTSYSKAKKMRIEIDFSESSEVCGPGKQFNTVYDQLYSFGDKLKELGISNLAWKEELNIRNLSNRSPKVTFACVVGDTIKLGSQINYAAKYAFSDEVRYIDIFDDKQFIEEDQFALDALENAKEKAQLLAELMGYKSIRVAYIDDDTSPSRRNGAKPTSLKREYRVQRKFFEEKEISRYKLFVGFELYN